MKIAYLCAQYPAISHTFILREVDALRSLGIEIDTFSIRRAGTEHLLADVDHLAFESTFAIRPLRWRALLGAHLKLAIYEPVAYISTLALSLRLAPAGLRGHLWQFFYFAQAVLLWSECSKRAIRHIHAHLANVAADVALLAAKIGSAIEPERPWSWSFTMHGPTEFFDVRHFRLVEKLQSASFVVCISDYARSQMMVLGDPKAWEKLHVIHVGLPLAQFTPLVDENKPAGEPIVLCVGRLVPEKGQAVLLEAVALLVASGLELDVVLAGEGPSRADLERLADDLEIAPRVQFRGAVGQEDIRELYASASIFCLPSFAEGIPVVLMEAMAMGCPVVSTRITGIPELIADSHNGLLVAPGRPDELAAALKRMIADPSLCHKLASSAREKIIRDFNAEHSAEQLYRLFARWLSGANDMVAT
jgi:glycosyltransferase involved in cell wall biosynthesis